MKRWWASIVSAERKRSPLDALWLSLFGILSAPYRIISKIQLARRKSRCSREWEAKTVSIGNITVGGSGKTPITMYLAELLQRKGKKVAIVHSGYGRKDKGEYIIKPGEISDFTVDQIGDEVAMMGEKLSQVGFAVGTDKKRMVKLADGKLRPDVILIDDGYQRLDIQKDIDIVALSTNLMREATGEVRRVTCYPFPRGILREPLSSLNRADAVFFIGEDESKSGYSEIRKFFSPEARVIRWVISISGVEIENKMEELSVLGGKRPCVFASIGSFDRLLRMLADKAIDTDCHYDFGDHHRYNDSDFARLRRISDRCSADCYLTTAKDMVKLSPTGLDKPVYCLQLEVRPYDEQALNDLIGTLD